MNENDNDKNKGVDKDNGENKGELERLAGAAADGLSVESKDHSEITPEVVSSLDLIAKIKNSYQNSTKDAQQYISIEVGENWGHLTIQKKLGEGAIGIVYEAYDAILERQVAVKFLQPDASEKISSKGFINEARRLAKVRHANILAIFGANTYKGVTGFWSDLIQGQTLDEVVNEGLSWQRIITIAAELSAAIDVVHRNEITHGDIKPTNVMLGDKRQAILMDFGSGSDAAKDNNELSSSTPLIMAPELFKGDRKSKASDIYALGALFYYLSSEGKFPIIGESYSQLKEHVIAGADIAVKNLSGPRQWQQLIKTMLDTKADQRPSAKAVSELINKIKQAPIKRLKKTAVYSLVLLLLTVAGASLFSFYQEKNSNKKITAALNETNEVNALMFDILTAVNPATKGKDVLMVDVIDDLIADIKSSPNISNHVRSKALLTSAYSLEGLGFASEGTELLDYIYALPEIENIMKAQVLVAQSKFINSTHERTKESISKSKAFLNQAQLIYPKIISSKQKWAAEFFFQKSMIFSWENKLDQAKLNANKSLEIIIAASPRKNTQQIMGRIYDLLGNIALIENDFDSAIAYSKQAIKAISLANPNLNQSIISARTNLATALRENGQYDEAIDIFNSLTEDVASFLGKETSEYFIVVMSLAGAHVSAKNYDLALQKNQEILSLIINKYGRDSMSYIYINNTLANVYMAKKDYTLAENTYFEIIALAEKKVGKSHEDTLLIYGNLAELYYRSGRPQVAIAYVLEKLPITRESLGDDSIYTINLNEALGWSYHLLGDDVSALPIMQDVLNRRSRIYEPDHESVVLATERLAAIKNALQSQ